MSRLSNTPGQNASAAGPNMPDSSTLSLTRREAREQEAKATQRPKLFAAASAPKRSTRPRTSTSPALAASAVAAKTIHVKRRVFSNLATIGVMAGVGLILISTTVPANAFSRPQASISASVSSGSGAKTQELEVQAAAAPTLVRDDYTVVSLVRQVEAQAGSRGYAFTNSPTAAVQWPFPGGSPITSGFGPRQVAGCGFCSTYHQGLDFTPGSGVPIQAIAAGTVSAAIPSGSGLGNHVIVDHVINGQRVQTLYAHMIAGSINVTAGQSVAVGQVLGAVGSTGASTGAHLHFEVHLDGTPIDPFSWLQANAG